MRTIALRYAEYFAPDEGTIKAHERIIEQLGFVWYGKMGTPVSHAIAKQILTNDNSCILLIHSGGLERYWAFIEDIQRSKPDDDQFPEYYRDKSDKFKTWFKVTRFESAPR